jgi:DNA-binding LytR/AlgR family response regulator
MKKYKCYIVDDEPLALNVIVQHASRFPQLEVCGQTTDPLEAMTQIRRLQPDLLFLDIQMPELTGLELLSSIHHSPEVIITTAYRDFAVEGFEMNVLDYLVKPIAFQRFAKSIDKFFEKVNSADASDSKDKPEVLQVRADRKFLRIPLDSILYIEGVKDYVKIVTPTQKTMTKVSIGNILKDLPADRFIQVHKSFIVARAKVTAFTAQDVLIGELEIPIGRTFKEDVMKRLEAGS